MAVFAVELKKALANRWFAVALGIGAVLAIASAMGNIVLYQNSIEQIISLGDSVDKGLSALSVFRMVMPADYIQPATDLFYALLFLMAVVPYGWSSSQEWQKGYVCQILSRETRRRYFVAKGAASFVAGACAIGFPLALNFIVCACWIPMFPTDVETVFNTGIYRSVMWSSLYYLHPGLYVVGYAALASVFAGLWAALIAFLSFFCKQCCSFADGVVSLRVFRKRG